MDDPNESLREAAFAFLAEQTEFYQGGILPWELLLTGFRFQGETVSLLGPQGIWRPRQMRVVPLSITTKPRRPGVEAPYDDRIEGSVLYYRYRGDERGRYINEALSRALELGSPLIYFRGVVPGWYLPMYPAWATADDKSSGTFLVEFKAAASTDADMLHIGDYAGPPRQYVETTVRRRVHQQEFHRMVLAAYRSRCGVCLLKHDRLLDASHILPDSHPRGEPVVPNGIALCKLHHAAYDADIIGVSPDLDLEIRKDVLEEKDGPMLVHGLQGFQGGSLRVPTETTLRPNRDFLAERYEQFLRTG